jgi:hypothetical protein
MMAILRMSSRVAVRPLVEGASADETDEGDEGVTEGLFEYSTERRTGGVLRSM